MVAASIMIAMLVACGTSDEPSVTDKVVVTWPGENGSTAGQVIVAISNDTDHVIDPDVFGRGSQTLAQLLDAGGADLPGSEMRVQLNAVPDILGPGESGYLFADFDVSATDVADARIELNVDRGETPIPVTVENFELVESADGVGATGRLAWDGSGTAVARAIALDADGQPIGYLTTSEVRYDAGDFEMCCFPPTVEAGDIEDVAVFGVRARRDG